MAYNIINSYTLVLAILWILKSIQTCTYDKFEMQNLIKYQIFNRSDKVWIYISNVAIYMRNTFALNGKVKHLFLFLQEDNIKNPLGLILLGQRITFISRLK